MSAPKYSSSNYDAAATKYKQLQDKYSGENGWNLAESQASKSADTIAANAGSTASSEASRAARSSGMTRGQAAAMGASQGALAAQSAYGNAYTNARSQALQNNQNTINSQGTLMGYEQQKDTNKYNSDSNRYGAAMGAVGGVFNGIASALSDENLKCVQDKTDNVEARRQELLARLRGEKK